MMPPIAALALLLILIEAVKFRHDHLVGDLATIGVAVTILLIEIVERAGV